MRTMRLFDRVTGGVIAALAIGLIAALAGGISAGPLDPPAAPGETNGVRLPGRPISSVPFTVTESGHYYVTQNLVYGGSGNAIEIAGFVEFVTIDLGGFTLAGSNSGVGIKAIGPSPPAQFPLSISNGYVRNFGVGISLELAAHSRVDNVHVYSNAGNGIELSNHDILSNCTSALNGGNGIRMNGAMATVSNCMVVDNGLSGVVVTQFGNVVEESEIYRNNTSVAAGHASIYLGTLSPGHNIIRNNNLHSFGNGASVHKHFGTGNVIIGNMLCSTAGDLSSDVRADNLFLVC